MVGVASEAAFQHQQSHAFVASACLAPPPSHSGFDLGEGTAAGGGGGTLFSRLMWQLRRRSPPPCQRTRRPMQVFLCDRDQGDGGDRPARGARTEAPQDKALALSSSVPIWR